MIPYLHFEDIMFGPITLHVWGVMVSFGIIIGLVLANYLIKKNNLNQTIIFDNVFYLFLGAFVGARLFHVFLYEPRYYLDHPADIIKIWQGGLSSIGGFFGAAIAFFILNRFKKWTFKILLPYLDIFALSLWLGWGIGRIGCFLTHLHPGALTNFFLGVKYPDGTRFDLGLIDSFVGFSIFAVFAVFFKRFFKKKNGFLAAYSAATYFFIRFFIDFLRVTPEEYLGGDRRFGFLTPAQWSILLAFLILFFWLIYKKIKRQTLKISNK